MGGYDIYRVIYDSLSSSWYAPENMGYPINTPDHDIYFVPTKDGKNAYYSSVRDDGYGNADIYRVGVTWRDFLGQRDPLCRSFVKLGQGLLCVAGGFW